MLTDDHPIVRDGLSSMLRLQFGWEVFCCASVSEMEKSISTFIPDIVIADILMPGGCVFRFMKDFLPVYRFKLVIYSGNLNDSHIRRTLAAGAAGIISKTDFPKTVEKCLSTVASGKTYFSKSVRERFMYPSMTEQNRGSNSIRQAYLSPREMEVLSFVGHGQANKLIAESLNISVKTVHRHKCNIMDKLDIHSSPELMKYALREGISSLEA